MRSEIIKFLNYLIGKRSEIQDLDAGDILLTKVILDIHRKKIGKRFMIVPLFDVKLIHPLDRPKTLQITDKRAFVLKENRENIIAARIIDRPILAEILPSISWIKVVKETDDSYIAYEGNGRLGAMQQVFTPEDGIQLEVEEYLFRNPDRILRRMNRVRRMNGIAEDGG